MGQAGVQSHVSFSLARLAGPCPDPCSQWNIPADNLIGRLAGSQGDKTSRGRELPRGVGKTAEGIKALAHHFLKNICDDDVPFGGNRTSLQESLLLWGGDKSPLAAKHSAELKIKRISTGPSAHRPPSFLHPGSLEHSFHKQLEPSVFTEGGRWADIPQRTPPPHGEQIPPISQLQQRDQMASSGRTTPRETLPFWN